MVGYDGLRRLTSADFGQNGLTGAYDLEQVSYDKNGNIETLKRRKDSGTRVDHLSYSYAFGTNRLQSLTDNAGAQHDWDAGSGSFGYDAVGNLTSTTAAPYDLSSVEYDERNLPTSITTGGTTTTYRYSLGGQRTYKQSGTSDPEYYVLDGRTTLAVVTGSSLDYWNVTLPSGEVIGRHLNSGGRRYYLKDHLGSVRVVVDGSGTVKETRDYYPFGLPMPNRVTTEATPAKEDFTGHERDSETGLHYAGARYYMSALGRWTSTDPLADDFPAWSPYNYSFSNPLAFNDPTGLSPDDIILRGQNSSSVTIETASIDVEVDVSSLPGTDFGGNHTIGGEGVVLAGLDIAGTFDPTPTSDALAASIYAEKGEYGNVLISGLGFIPAFGDVGKLARVGKHIDTVKNAVGRTEKGGLNLFKWGQESTTTAKGWKQGDRMLYLPNQGSPKANWKQNAGRLRQEMRRGEPIFDSYRDPRTGQQIPTGGFLNAERKLLESRGWTYNPTTGAYHPPSN